MRAFIAGATGVLGKRLVAELAERGHEVVGLSRDDEGDEAVRERGGEPRRGDVFDRDSLVDAAAGADVVVHAATAIPTSDKPTEAEWALNDRVRREGTRNLLAAADAVGADRFLLQSVSWVARQPDGSAFDEDSEPNPEPTTQSALDAERLVQEAADDGAGGSFDASILRCGFFYAPDSAHTRQFGEGLLAGDVPLVGGGLLGRQDAPISFLHVEDAARAFADAAEVDATGLWHVVDDEPVAPAVVLQSLADRLGAPEPSRVPGWLARFFVGAATVRLLTRAAPTSNDRFRTAVGWEPTYPTYREGLDAVVEAWKRDGTLREASDGYEWRGEADAPLAAP